MLSVRLICVGKMRERFYIDAFSEYAKRLQAYCRLECVELAEQRLGDAPSQKEIRRRWLHSSRRHHPRENCLRH